MAKELKVYNLSEELFDRVLTNFEDRVIKVEDFSQYVSGGKFKSSIIFDGIKKIVITEKLLFSQLQDNAKEPRTDWVQCICVKKHKQKVEIQDGISGGFAFRVLKAKIMKAGQYTEEQFHKQLSLFEKEYDPDKAQYHMQYYRDSHKIYKYKNCRKYDINGAYAKALTIIFPKAKQEIIKLYNDRKENPINKDLINYFVGMLCVKDHRKTFNWIVQEVRKLMEREIEYCDGILLYANTDGFAICSNKNNLNTSSELGDFKLEYEGDMYTYGGDNYWIIQAGDEITGSLLYQARPFVNLREGQTVQYRRIKYKGCQIATDIITINLKGEIINGN